MLHEDANAIFLLAAIRSPLPHVVCGAHALAPPVAASHALLMLPLHL
jgi:hypothetical protein